MQPSLEAARLPPLVNLLAAGPTLAIRIFIPFALVDTLPGR